MCWEVESAHEVSDLFNANNYGVLVMQACNAFNSINQIGLIWNIHVLWSRASRFIFNTYRGWSPLIFPGSDAVIFSFEGVVQGDPLSMFSYAVATIPLIRQLEDSSSSRTQLWFADDSSVVGEISTLRQWMATIQLFSCATKESLIVRVFNSSC